MSELTRTEVRDLIVEDVLETLNNYVGVEVVMKDPAGFLAFVQSLNPKLLKGSIVKFSTFKTYKSFAADQLK